MPTKNVSEKIHNFNCVHFFQHISWEHTNNPNIFRKSVWSPCSKSCVDDVDRILGNRTRTREIESGPKYGGKDCLNGDRIEISDCPRENDNDLESGIILCPGNDSEKKAF